MPTAISAIETQVRRHLDETTAKFWSSAELVDITNQGIRDLWGAIVDLNQEHWFTEDETNVSLAANATSLTGVPADVFRVMLLEPRDTTVTPGKDIYCFPRDRNSDDFKNARAMTAQDPTGGLSIFYTLTQAGAPVGAPTILTAPALSTALNMRLVYVPTPTAVAVGENNPVPGQSDNALIAWTIAYARAKEREARDPDPAWIAIYATEKANLLTRLTPRQIQEPDVVEDLFGRM